MKKILATILLVALVTLAACTPVVQPPAPAPAPTQAPPAVAPTQVPPTAVPTQAPAATEDPASAAEPGALYSTETVPCPSSLAQGAAFAASGAEVEGQTYSCGVVVVPENYDQPDGRTIELFYLKLHSSSKSPEPDPLVYLAGGPGSSGSYELTANPLLYQNIGKIRERRDIIAYDQRGTGFSNYLLCAPFESALGVLQDRDKNPQIAATIKDLQDTSMGIGYGALRANLCGVGTRLLAGVDLGQYNSVSSAKDIPALAKALGYTEGVNLYGTSYGTKLAQFAMRTVPESVNGVILDGPSGPAIPNAMWAGVKNVSPYVELFKQCGADTACNAAYPDLAKRFGALLEKLEKTPLVFDPPLVVNPPLTVVLPPVLKQIDADFFVKMATLDNIALGGGFASSLPIIIDAAERGDVAFFRTSSLAASTPAKDTPKTVVPPAKDPTPALQADQPLFEVPFLTLLSLAQTAAAAQGQAGFDIQWLSVVLGDLGARLQAGENQADLMEALLNLSVVPNKGSTAKELTDYANAALSPSAATAANAVAGQMTRNDVRATMWSIQDVAMALGTTKPDERRLFSDGMQTAVNCADEVAFTSLDVAKAAVADAAYPQLAVFPLEVAEQSLDSCVAYPTTLDRSVTDPVVSDIPTLLFLGHLDNETPIAWGRSVAEGLSKSTVVEWENMGHIAAAHDDKLCAGGIASDFLSDPSKAPDLTCAQSDAYKLKFALPEGTPAAKSSK
jgi:pimeloyl-ACP methyl ester carboxylesterase